MALIKCKSAPPRIVLEDRSFSIGNAGSGSSQFSIPMSLCKLYNTVEVVGGLGGCNATYNGTTHTSSQGQTQTIDSSTLTTGIDFSFPDSGTVRLKL